MKREPKTQVTAAPAEPGNAKAPTLRSRLRTGETPADRVADMIVEGLAMNAITTLRFSSTISKESELTEVFAHVLENAEAVKKGDHTSCEVILGAQVVSLNAIYTQLAGDAHANFKRLDVFERLLRLAFKAQSQCRAAAESLAFMRNPGGAVFAKQANIAHGPQQVNNGVTSAARADETKSRPNELIEPKRIEAAHEPMDTRTTRATSATDSRLAPVGQVHRATKRRR